MKPIIILLVSLVILGVSGVWYLSSVDTQRSKATNFIVPPLAASGEQCASGACAPDVPVATDESAIIESPQTTNQEGLPTSRPVSTPKAVVPGAQVIINPAAITTLNNQVPYTEFVSPEGFLNSEPFRLADYIGQKIILIEFITYSCVNCQRTFPYLQAWHEKYHDDGLLVVGIHTPEFAYEQVKANVAAALKKEGITFPVVQDNDYQTWNAYGNRFWPHRYLIDGNGKVVFDHVGEGAYPETEKLIQLHLELLNQRTN